MGDIIQEEETRYEFTANTSSKHLERMRKAREEAGEYGVSLQQLYIGLAATKRDGHIDIGVASHDGTYSIDFAIRSVKTVDEDADGIPDYIDGEHRSTDLGASLAEYMVKNIRGYEKEHLYKFVGVGISKKLVELSPQLPARLWADLDIVPLVFEMGMEYRAALTNHLSMDEEADSMARKCLMFFGPTQQPRVQIGFRNQVEVDSSGHGQLTYLDQYKESVGEGTWKATMKYVESVKRNKTKIAFFNSTPQGGGVALMRHALIRFFRLAGVDCKWYVPRPKPEVFRITKTNHNILQGVASPKERLSDAQKETWTDWVQQNAKRFWTNDGGPLAPRSKGGADVVIIDDPQMPNLVEIAKQADPDRPVIFRSHIQVRSDLADKEGTPTSEVWNWIWQSVKQADLFISHPVREFVPRVVDFKTVGYMPATTDWFDGLNKELSDWDSRYYLHEFNTECHKSRMTELAFPRRDYIAQIARFDPSKGIPDVLAAYAELRRKHMAGHDRADTPQLVIAGHGAVDDPDGTVILDQTIEACEKEYADLRDDIVVMRLGPTDQLLNALISNAKVVLQLSTREGFEVKVSEALHKGIPVIATRAGGIPLQVQDGRSGFLVEPGDSGAVARHLNTLFTDDGAYREMSRFAAAHVSDEVSTVGNALAWLYLADTLAGGEVIRPDSAWINDLAREKAGCPYQEGETRLPRKKELNLT